MGRSPSRDSPTHPSSAGWRRARWLHARVETANWSPRGAGPSDRDPRKDPAATSARKARLNAWQRAKETPARRSPGRPRGRRVGKPSAHANERRQPARCWRLCLPQQSPPGVAGRRFENTRPGIIDRAGCRRTGTDPGIRRRHDPEPSQTGRLTGASASLPRLDLQVYHIAGKGRAPY